ncbi:MAG TPA: VOC family protein [Methylomirabilota bacterium]|nr:VOC family protein [Methylomirabilota bacterium]
MAVKGLIHYALEVPDPAKGAAFYRDFGLAAADGGGAALRLEAGRGAGALLLYAGPTKRLHHVAFAAPGENFAAVRAALKRAGVPEIEPPKEAPQTGIWLRDPDENLVNIRQEAPVAIAAEAALAYNGPGNAPRQGARGMPTFERALPRRLGHVLFFTPDPQAAERFYTGVLGFKVSDRVPGLLSFLRCSTDHHNLAFAKSSHRGFHHASYEVGSFDEVGMGGMWMRAQGWEPAWGMGRHAIGSNVFYYIRDPWGSFAEYFHDIDCIPEDAAWEPRDWEAKYALYCWGPDVPPDFIENKEAAG